MSCFCSHLCHAIIPGGWAEKANSKKHRHKEEGETLGPRRALGGNGTGFPTLPGPPSVGLGPGKSRLRRALGTEWIYGIRGHV